MNKKANTAESRKALDPITGNMLDLQDTMAYYLNPVLATFDLALSNGEWSGDNVRFFDVLDMVGIGLYNLKTHLDALVEAEQKARNEQSEAAP